MWRTGLLYLDRGDSPLMAALRDSNYNQQTSPVSPTRRMSVSSNAESVRSESRTRQEISKQAMQSWMVPPEAASGIKFGSRVKVDDAVDQLSSPMSEMGLSEEPSSYALDRIREDDAPPGYFSYEDGERSVNGDDEKQMQVARSRPRHSRTPSSTPSTPISPTTRMSRMMPARAKTSEGLLQLQANPAKAQRPTSGHQRKVSLGLPIRSPTAPTAEVKQNKSKASKRLSVSEVLPQSTRPKPSAPASMVQQERELEYLHRHTFVGTASLDDFLEVLEVSPEHTTTKSAIINAFLLLASSERQLARQASVKPSGWGLVSKTINETCDVDYVEQAHAKLGSIVLRQFLDLISFDEDEVASAMSVVEAFSASSYLDTKANSALSSKAKAFRCWMVTQNAGKA